MPSPSRFGTATVFRPLRAGSARRGRHGGQPTAVRHFCLGFCLGGLKRLQTLRMRQVLWVQRIDAKIAAILQRQAQEEYGRTSRPQPPEWIAELGNGTRRPPLQVHAGDCSVAGKRHRAVDRDEARRLLASGLKACGHCRPDVRLHIIDSLRQTGDRIMLAAGLANLPALTAEGADCGCQASSTRSPNWSAPSGSRRRRPRPRRGPAPGAPLRQTSRLPGGQRWVQTMPVQSPCPVSSQQQTTYSPSSSPVSQPGSTRGTCDNGDRGGSPACAGPAEPSSSEASTVTIAGTAIAMNPDIPGRWRTFVGDLMARPCLSDSRGD
ncbi:hypothetical protein GCM10010377_52320 [Streptomyces viridiviolaceus]|nr:hypothetical protein GCM10010377_52320 [Streptomyces viridiviolaceus]